MADRRGYRTFAVLDIGTSKIAAAVVVAELGQNGSAALRVAGLGLQRSQGVKAGVLTNLDDVENIVRAAIGQAERTAGIRVEGVSVSVSCGRIGSQHFTARAVTEMGFATEAELDRLRTGSLAFAEREGRALLHMNSLGFEIDGLPGVQMPIGLAARNIAGSFHAVTADEAPLRNILMLIDRSFLACDGMVATPYASGLAATSAEERKLGVTCIDVGCGTTSLALFADGRFIGADVVPVGGQHITYDIAKALHTPLAEAERIKTLYGTLLPAQSDEHDVITYPIIGEDDEALSETTRARLSAIIRPRVAQILGFVRERLALNPASAWAGDRIVLTGGASQLIGFADFAAREVSRPVRLGRPLDLPGLTSSLSGPPLATLVGLALTVGHGEAEFVSARGPRATASGYLGRVGSWLRRGL